MRMMRRMKTLLAAFRDPVTDDPGPDIPLPGAGERLISTPHTSIETDPSSPSGAVDAARRDIAEKLKCLVEANRDTILQGKDYQGPSVEELIEDVARDVLIQIRETKEGGTEDVARLDGFRPEVSSLLRIKIFTAVLNLMHPMHGGHLPLPDGRGKDAGRQAESLRRIALLANESQRKAGTA